MEALLEKVIVKITEGDKSSDMFLDFSTNESLIKAEVISVGLDREGYPLTGIEAGDTVFIDGKSNGKPIPDTDDWVLINYHQVQIKIK